SATADITLKALFSHTETSAAAFELVTEAPDAWEGSYVITYGKTNEMTVLKGVAGTKKLETAKAGACAAFNTTGMALNGETLENVTNDYIFTVAAAGGKFTVQNAATGTYLASRGGYLYSYKTNTASYNRWTFAIAEGTVDATNAASTKLPHLGFNTSKNYFAIARTADPEICFWKMGGVTETTTYTTVIG
ncbi:MAG: hypothetical protein IJL59_07585, partial [Clostridia bacterium]|nr:hypothetical protein [Clostridia bacterium]